MTYAVPPPHRGFPLRLLAGGRLVCALYLASISHVDPIHMGDTSHIQGTHTVDESQHPGWSGMLPRALHPPSQFPEPRDALFLTSLADAVLLNHWGSIA